MMSYLRRSMSEEEAPQRNSKIDVEGMAPYFRDSAEIVAFQTCNFGAALVQHGILLHTRDETAQERAGVRCTKLATRRICRNASLSHALREPGRRACRE